MKRRTPVGRPSTGRLPPDVLELFDRVMEAEIFGEEDREQRDLLWDMLDLKPWDAAPCFFFDDAPVWIAREPQLLERWRRAKSRSVDEV